MSDGVVIALILAGGALLTTIAWKVLDIGKRAMELDRRHRSS
jgi:hypothetical protein